MPELTGFVLAGGRSRRMGTDKALLRWGDGTLMEHMTRTLRAVADPVRVVGRDQLPDRRPGLGPVEGIATALGATTTDRNVVVAVDLPYLNAALLAWIAARLGRSETGIVICTVDGRAPLCLGLHRGVLPAVDRYLNSGGRSVRGFLGSAPHDVIAEEQFRNAGFSPEMFRNLNAPEDYLG